MKLPDASIVHASTDNAVAAGNKTAPILRARAAKVIPSSAELSREPLLQSALR